MSSIHIPVVLLAVVIVTPVFRKISPAGILTIKGLKKLKEIFDALKHAQVKDLYLEHLNLSTYVKERLLKKLKGEQDEVIRRFYEAGKGEYKEKLNTVIKELLKDYNFKIRLGEVLEHGKKTL